MTSSEFDVSVVIPLYNHASYIGEAIDSVLAQTLPAHEIIVIDDGSRDNGGEIARRKLAGHPAAIVLNQANVGAHETINRCISKAKSRFVAVLNSDDLFEPGKLSRCAQLFASQRDLDLIFGDVSLIDDNGLNVNEGPTFDWLQRSRNFLQRCDRLDLALANENFAVTTSNFVFTKAIWERTGGFQPLRYCHDLDFVFAALGGGRVLFDATFPHIRYRVHGANTIKEYVNKVRVEIAAVLASALGGGLLADLDGGDKGRLLTMFDQALSSKGLGSLLPFLTARFVAFGGDRPAFYDWAIGDAEVNATLLAQVEGALADHMPSPQPEREFYLGGAVEADIGRAISPVFVRPNSIKQREEDFRTVLENARTAKPISQADLLGGLSGPVVVELSAFDRGGLEKVVLDTSIVLRNQGLDSIIVSCGPVGHLGDLARQQNFIVYELSQDDPHAHYRRILKDHGVKLAISHFSRIGYPVFRELGIPNITFIHNVYAFLGGQALANFKADDAYVDRYIAVSPKASDYAASCLGVDASKIVTVPNGLIIEEHIARVEAATPITRAELGLTEDDYVFLNVASYNLHKGHYLMAEAMKMLLNKTDRVKILCIGNTIVPHHVQGLREHLNATGVADHMLLPGYFPDVGPFYAISDAFLLPSFIEGWSIAMNEAMFFGKPMILSDTGGSSEVIKNNDIGILLPNEYGSIDRLHSELLDEMAYDRRHFRTAPFLARAMLDFSSDPECWREAGMRGHQRLLGNYNFIDVVRSYLPIFRDVMEGTGESLKAMG